MAEYVKKAFLLEGIELSIVAAKAIADGNSVALKAVDIMQTLRDFVAKAPAADVEPVVHGRWVQVVCHVEYEDGFVDRLYECCSRCHEPNGRKTSDYCPNCGARMDGGDGDA